jgi:hypothetical protein
VRRLNGLADVERVLQRDDLGSDMVAIDRLLESFVAKTGSEAACTFLSSSNELRVRVAGVGDVVGILD